MNSIKKYFLFVVLALVSAAESIAQKEAANWYFGQQVGIDFNLGTPVVTTNITPLWVMEGSAVMSDNNGNILFYTDARQIWDRNHIVMPNGSGLIGGGITSSTQAAIIVPWPGSATKYFVFTLPDGLTALADGFRYHVVDMSLNGGFGNVTTKNVLLNAINSEKITAVKHCNGIDYWVVTHDMSNNFLVYLVSAAGLSAPTIYAIGPTYSIPNYDAAGQMKFSPDGSKLAVAIQRNSIVSLFDFNNATGVISNPLVLNDANLTGAYGIEFSPDATKLYVTLNTLGPPPTGYNYYVLHQYDLCTIPSSAIFNTPSYVFRYASSYPPGPYSQGGNGLQQAIDGKIYCAENTGAAQKLGVVNSPNTLGAGCNFVPQSLSTAPNMCWLSLTSFIQSYFDPYHTQDSSWLSMTYDTTCLNASFLYKLFGQNSTTACLSPNNTPVAVAWNFGDPASGASNSSVAATPNHGFTSAGTYSVSLVVSFNCKKDTIRKLVTVVDCSSNLSVQTNVLNIPCYNSCSGNASAIGISGSPPYSYLWSNAQTTTAISGLCAGTYSVLVTDAAAVTASATITITQPTVLTSTISAINSNCAIVGNATVTVTGGTPGYTYSWSNGQTTQTATGLSVGTYSVLITDVAGCTKTALTSISNTSPPLASISATNILCNGGNNGGVVINVTGGTAPYTYIWFPGGQTSSAAIGLGAGIYIISVTDAMGCIVSRDTQITEPPVITSTISSTNTSCSGLLGTATVTASGGTNPFAYTWSNGQTSQTATGLAAGNYTATITDSNGCTKTETVSITQPTAITVSVTTNTASCLSSNGNATAAASGGNPAYTYSWSNGQTSQTATGLAAGTYTAIITDANGCTQTALANVSNTGSPQANISSSTNILCNGGNNGSANVNVTVGSAPYTYSWNPSAQTTSAATGLAAGNYAVTVTDALGCIVIVPTTITEPPVLTTSVGSTNVSCTGILGTANIASSGGTSSYTYLWNPSGGNSSTATGLSAGNYSVTITDANGCTKTQTVIITQPTAITVSVTTTTASCLSSNGNATAAASGGNPAYTYSWSNGQTTQTATGLAAGTYTATITDANGCTQTALANVSNTGSPQANISALTNILCNGGNNGSTSVNVAVGTAPYNYSWNPSGQTAATATGLSAGNYQVTVTDALGCIVIVPTTITEPTLLTASVILETG